MFIKDHETAIKTALLKDDLKTARRLVNGGSHGLDQFTEAYNIGNGLLSDA
jgi:peptidoglycan L-alanyl-D-glutamate endopeptidase CwlK